MNNANINKFAREEQYQDRNQNRFGRENSFEKLQSSYYPQADNLELQEGILYKDFSEAFKNHMYPSYNLPPSMHFPQIASSIPSLNGLRYRHLSPAVSLENKNFPTHEGPMIRGKTPPNSNFFMNPVSDNEQRRLRIQEDYKAYARQDIGRRKEEQPEPANVGFKSKPWSEQPQIDDERKRLYNLELKRQIEEKEARKKVQKQKEMQEEYFPFGKPGAGAPNRDREGNILANRPPRFNENEPNFNRGAAKPSSFIPRDPAEYLSSDMKSASNQYVNSPPQAYQPSVNYGFNGPSMQFPPNGSNPIGSNRFQPQNFNDLEPPEFNAPPPRANFDPNPQPLYPSRTNLSPQSNNLIAEEPRITREKKTESERNADAAKKLDLQRALQEQIEEKKRQKDEEKRKKLLEEKYEEEKLAKERMQMAEDIKREAEKKKKQINDLQAFNHISSGNAVVQEPIKKTKRPRTPIDLPPPEPQPAKPVEEPRRRGQSAIARNPIQGHPNEIPPEYINFLNLALDRKLYEFKSEYKIQELKQQEEIQRLRLNNIVNTEQNIEAQREIGRLKEELRRKQMEEEIKHRELAFALANPKSLVNNNKARVPSYEQRYGVLAKNGEDPYFSIDLAQKSLISESKFIPLPAPQEVFPKKPLSPRDKKVFPSLLESNSNYETFRSAGASLGIDVHSKKNEERLKAHDKFNPEAQDELNKLDDLLFKFCESDKKNPEIEGEKRTVEVVRSVETPAIFGRGEILPSIRELDAEVTYSLHESDKKQPYQIY